MSSICHILDILNKLESFYNSCKSIGIYSFSPVLKYSDDELCELML